MTKNFYTVKEVATILKVSTNTVYKYLADGTIVATRLGDEGRFKIPVSEVARLQGNPLVENPVDADPNTAPETPSEHPSSAPQLFDWLIALTVLFSAVSNLSNPIKIQGLSSGNITGVFMLFQIVSLVSASLLFLLELFDASSRKIVSFVTRSVVAISCGVIGLLFFRAGEPWTASFWATLSVGAILSYFFQRVSSESKTIIYGWLLSGLTAIGFSQKPEAFIFADIRYEVSHNPLAFVALVVILATMVCAILLFAYKRSRVLYPIFTTAVGLFLLGLTVNFITSQSWNRTISCLFLGSFFLVLPISNEIDTFARFTRRQLMFSFLWVAAVLGLGILGIKGVQTYTLTVISAAATSKAQTAALTANQIVTDATNSLLRLSNDPELKSKPITTTAIDMFHDRSRSLYFSTSIFRRVFFVTPDGLSFAEYPTILTAPNDIANRDYIVKVSTIRQPVISQVSAPSVRVPGLTPTIYIVVPVLSDSGEYLGAIGGALDPGIVEDRLTLGVQSAGSEIAVQDDAGNFLFGQGQAHPNGTPNHLDFNSKGLPVYQSIAEVPSIGWTVTLSQLYDVAFRESSLLSSAVFFLCAIAGIGSLLINMHVHINRPPDQKS